MTPDINKILRKNPRSGKFGAPLGARNHHDSTSRVYLQRIRFVDGDYGADGTYWGQGSKASDRLWCAFNGYDDPDFEVAQGTRAYVRAATREEAKTGLLETYPDMEFIR